MPVDIKRGFDEAGGELMADLVYDFPINAPVEEVFAGVATPEGLDAWWTIRSSGEPRVEEEYELDFGPGYSWRAKVTRCETNADFELTMTASDQDWMALACALYLHRKAKARTYSSRIPDGRKRMNITGFRAFAGRCICGC